MAIDRPKDRRTSTRVQHEDVESEAMTIEDIYASLGKGTPPDLEGGVFHASTEDFIAAMQARRRDAAQ